MTSIEWTDEVWNPSVGCSRVSPGCEACYAERFAHRGLSPEHRGLTVMTKHGPRWTGEVRFLPERLSEPLRWRKPRRVFVNSMSDLFHEALTNEQIAAVFGVMAAAPRHTFQVLTKRARRMREWFEWLSAPTPGAVRGPEVAGCILAAGRALGTLGPQAAAAIDGERAWPLPNVWLGVSAEDQQRADERIPDLLACPAAVRFVSYEPALGPVDFTPWLGRHPDACTCDLCFGDGPESHPGLSWLIIGGESGPNARPFDLAWARSAIEQCKAAGVACFVKQLGARPIGAWVDVDGVTREVPHLDDRAGRDMAEWPADLRVREFPR